MLQTAARNDTAAASCQTVRRFYKYKNSVTMVENNVAANACPSHTREMTNSNNALLQSDLYGRANPSFVLIIHSLCNTMK